jgi:hypothetical protein
VFPVADCSQVDVVFTDVCAWPLSAIALAGKAKARALTTAAIDFDLMLPVSLS